MISSRKLPLNPVIKTYGSNPSRDYTDLATWESDTDNDLVTSTQGQILECYIDGNTSGYNDGSKITINGANTDEDYFRVIKAAEGEEHNGNPEEGVQFNITGAMWIPENYFQLQDVTITRAGPTDPGWNAGIRIDGEYSALVGVIVKDCIDTTTGNKVTGVTSSGDYSPPIGRPQFFINCMFIGNKVGLYINRRRVDYIYNCIISNCESGIELQAKATYPERFQTVELKNTIFEGNEIDIDYNPSLTRTKFHKVSCSFNSLLEYPEDDYRFYLNYRDKEIAGIGTGVDLSTDSIYSFSDTIDKKERIVWDIGPFLRTKTSRKLPKQYNIKTLGPNTIDYDYDNINDWITYSTRNLVSEKIGEVLECYPNGPALGDPYILSATATLTGATTNEDYFRVIKPAKGYEHNGIPDSGVKFIRTVGSGNVFDIDTEPYSSIYDIEAEFNSDTLNNMGAFRLRNSNNSSYVGCIGRAVNINSTPALVTSFRSLGPNPAVNHYIINCLAYKSVSNDSSAAGVINNSINLFIYNSTIVDNDNGVILSGGNISCINTISINTSTDFDTGVVINNCLTSGVAFKDQLNNNYHLNETDTTAMYKGVDTFEDNMFAFGDDVIKHVPRYWQPIGFHTPRVTSRKLPKNPNISTYGDASRDYTSLSAWELATNYDLVTSQQGEILHCYSDSDAFYSSQTPAAFSGSIYNVPGTNITYNIDELDIYFNDSVIMNNSNTSSDYFRVIMAAPGHEHGGNLKNGVRFYKDDTSHLISISNEDYSSIYDIDCEFDSTTSSDSLLHTVSSIKNKFSGLLIKATGGCYGIYIDDNSGDEVYVVNSIIYDCDNIGMIVFDSNAYIYNSLVINCSGAALHKDYSMGTLFIAKNCILYNNNVVDVNLITCETDENKVEFKDLSTNNYQIKHHSLTKHVGTTLRTDSYYPFNDDINNNDRTIVWDLGQIQSSYPRAWFDININGIYSPSRILDRIAFSCQTINSIDKDIKYEDYRS